MGQTDKPTTGRTDGLQYVVRLPIKASFSMRHWLPGVARCVCDRL